MALHVVHCWDTYCTHPQDSNKNKIKIRINRRARSWFFGGLNYKALVNIMKLPKFIELVEKHRKWLNNEEGGARLEFHSKIECDTLIVLRSANLSLANLSSADLSSANLRSANLSSANLDFSSGISFRCSSLNFKANLRLAAQLAYHFCSIDFGDCEDTKKAQEALKELANKSHLINGHGLPKI